MRTKNKSVWGVIPFVLFVGLRPSAPAQVPVSLPAGATLAVSWSNSPTGPGSSLVRDGFDDEADGPSYGAAIGTGYFILSPGVNGPALVLSQAAPSKFIPSPSGPVEVGYGFGFQVTMGGQFPGPGEGWTLVSSTASPFSATFTANMPQNGQWGGEVTFTFTQAP